MSIGDSAFIGCVRLANMTIPNSVTSIGDSAFFACSGLTSVTIPDSVTSIESWAFRYCSSLTNVSLPKSLKGELDEGSVFCDCCDDLKISYRDTAAPAKKAAKKTAKKK